MSGEKLIAGAVVRLKSGGQNMTIESIDISGARCAWFDKSDLKTAFIKIAALEVFTPSEKRSLADIGKNLA